MWLSGTLLVSCVCHDMQTICVALANCVLLVTSPSCFMHKPLQKPDDRGSLHNLSLIVFILSIVLLGQLVSHFG